MISSYSSLTHAANSFQESNEALDDITPQNQGNPYALLARPLSPLLP